MIVMTGMDHTTAPVDVRSRFSFTKDEMRTIMEDIKTSLGLKGLVLITTCNRMELWADFPAAREPAPADGGMDPAEALFKTLCRLKHADPAQNGRYFINRKNEEAVDHLFYLTCGLKSAILAEDQIITQVMEALAFAHENRMADSLLEVLFRMAVTGAKRVKTEVVFSHANETAIDAAIAMLCPEGGGLSGRKCLVIGNGEMGKLSAAKLRDCGADVTVTVRQYRSGHVQIPEGCRAIDYRDRYTEAAACSLIVSATTSPHYTITADGIGPCLRDAETPKVLIDLAVPRDIEPEVGEMPGARLFNIDDFQTSPEQQNDESYRQAEAVLREEIDAFWFWADGRSIIPHIQKIQSAAGRDVMLRLQKPIRRLEAETEAKSALEAQIEKTSEKVIGKLLFAMRESLDPEEFNRCIACLEELYQL